MAKIDKQLIASILEVGKTALPLLGPQGAAAAGALQALDKLLKQAKEAAGPADAKDLDDLQKRVNDRARKLIAELRGEAS